ncbi:glycosyltransferase [Angustibacter sp. Root456]|uniref:glycosyltransferase n=1 Tax=Angustibacter sp. Root456 TaxID=1736539 RepID=UPI0019102D19
MTYHSADVLPGLLDSLPAAMDGIDQWQLVVVDNDSCDGSLDVVAQLAPDALRLSTGRNAGYAAAINHALERVPASDDVLVLNPDVRLEPGAVAALRTGLRTSGAGVAVPRIIGADGAPRPSLRRDPTLLRALGEAVLGGRRAGRRPWAGEVVVDPSAYERPGWVDWATGAVLLVSARCRAAVGPWDEGYFLYSEETDFCLRARAAGFGIRYVPSATAEHLEGGGESDTGLRPVLVNSKQRLYRRHHGPWAAAAFRAVGIANEASRAARPSHRAALRTLVTGEVTMPPGVRRPAVVLFSAQDYWYHNRAHSDVQLARHMSHRTPVLLVNSIGMRMPTPGRSTQSGRRILRKLRSTARALRRPERDNPDLYVLSPAIVPAYSSPALRRLSAALVRAQVRIALRAMGQSAPPDVVVTIPTAVDVVERLPRRTLLVNRSDKYSAFPETDQRLIESLEHRLLGQADAAVYVSRHLLNAERSLTAGRSVYLGHGVDYDRFVAAHGDRVPADIARIPSPRIGFFGGIDDYVVDLDLVRRLALELPEAHIVLIGDATCSMESLTALPNVHWLGARPYEQIPAYGAAFDVAIMPWLRNEWIEHCNPIKAMEYLALGLPVVTIRYAEVDALADVMDVADSPDEFVTLVRKALDGGRGDPTTRRAAVREHSWQVRADEVLRELDLQGDS